MIGAVKERLGERRALYDQVDWDAVEPYQLEVRADMLNLLPADTRSILDLGCGNGIIANALPTELAVVGADISIAALRRLTRPACVASGLLLPFADGAFDLVMTNDVIEHLPDSEFDATLREIERVATRYVVTTVPFFEDLGASWEFSGESAAPHHVNDHYRSFDLGVLQRLYKDFELDSVVFSGSEWQSETRPIEALTALIKELQGTQATADPSQAVLTDDNAAESLRMLRAQQARELGERPGLVEFSRLRTEVICLYRRRGRGCQHPLRHAIRSRSETAETVPVTAVDLGMIDFRNLERHHRPWLPENMSRFPYLVTSAATCPEPGGARFGPNDETDSCEIKVGFFCNSEAPATLEIIGSATSEVTLSIAHYGAVHQYRPIASERVCGYFRIALTDLDLSHSQYGMLFSIAITGGHLFLRSVRLSAGRPSYRMIYTMAPEYLSAKYDEIDCFLSCRFYGKDVPVLPWFKTPIRLPSTAAVLHSARHRLAAEIGTTFKVAALLKTRLEELSARQENEFSKLHRDHAAQARALEEARHREAQVEGQIKVLRGELKDAHLVQQRAFDEVRETHLAQLGELRSQLQDWRREFEDKENVFIEKMHGLTEAVLRLEVGSKQLAQRVHVVERVLSPLFPTARYVSRMRHAVGRRLVPARLKRARVPQLALDPPPATAKLGRTAVMLVADDRIDRRVLAQARSLVAEGWRVSVIAVPYPGPLDLDQEAFPEVRIARIDTNLPAPRFARPASRRLSATRNWIEAYFYHDHFLELALQHPATIVTAHDLPVLPAAIAAAESCGARVVYDAHELYPEQHHFGPELSELYRKVEGEIIGFADAVTTVNLSIANEMAQRYGIPLPQIVLNAPEVDRASLPMPRGNLIRERLQLPDSRRILLFQGALSLNRNLENLTRAMAHVRAPDIALVFLGSGDEKRAELSEIAAGTCTLGSKVFFLNAVDQRHLLEFTASADIGIVPYPPIDLNSRLCTPNKLFEFIVAGVPILANDLPELRRFVYHNEFGQVHPLNDPESIAAAIDAMCAADLERYRQNLRARCHEFTWEQQAGVITALYERLFAELQASDRH